MVSLRKSHAARTSTNVIFALLWMLSALLLFAAILPLRGWSQATPGTAACPAPESQCGTTCADLNRDLSNCGSCGNTCQMGETCAAGKCTPRITCKAGQNNCSGRCLDLSKDKSNCGACGNACAAGQKCSKGACTGTVRAKTPTPAPAPSPGSGRGAALSARIGVRDAAWTPSHTPTTIRIAAAAATVAPFLPRAVAAASAAARRATPAAWDNASAAAALSATTTTVAAAATPAPSDRVVSAGRARGHPLARPATSPATEKRLRLCGDGVGTLHVWGQCTCGTGALARPGRAELGKIFLKTHQRGATVSLSLLKLGLARRTSQSRLSRTLVLTRIPAMARTWTCPVQML